MMDVPMGFTNNVLLVKIEGAVWYTIYHQTSLLLKGFLQTPLLINQPMGKGHLCDSQIKSNDDFNGSLGFSDTELSQKWMVCFIGKSENLKSGWWYTYPSEK